MRELAPNTRRAYAADWCHFSKWCEERAGSPWDVSADIVARYLCDLSAEDGSRTPSIATVTRRYAAIKWHLASRGRQLPQSDPDLRNMLDLLRAQRKPSRMARRVIAPVDHAVVISSLELRKVRHVRDKAMLLLSLVGGLRPRELVSVHLGVGGISQGRPTPVARLRRGLLEIAITTSRGRTRRIRIPRAQTQITCVVSAVVDWLRLSRITSGPLFRRIGKDQKITGSMLLPAHVAAIMRRAILKTAVERARSSERDAALGRPHTKAPPY